MLTPTERRIVQLASNGLTNEQIALELAIEASTVRWYLRNVVRKIARQAGPVHAALTSGRRSHDHRT